MKRFSEAGVALESRSIGQCLDLAYHVLGRRFLDLGALYLSIAIPAVVLTYIAALSGSFGWFFAGLILALASIPLSLLLVTYAAALAMAEPLTPGQTWRRAVREQAGVGLLRVGYRVLTVCGWCFIIPGVMLQVYPSFQTENRAFRRYRRQSHEHPLQGMVGQAFTDLMMRAVLLMVFTMVLWFTVLLTTDAAAMLLVGVSPVFGPLAEGWSDPWGYADGFDRCVSMLGVAFTNPQVLSIAVATGLFVYTFARLAWFFVYVDLRITADLWDLEVAMSAEVERWAETNA
jgi:hypothetical protein